jgi:hypothetical protein
MATAAPVIVVPISAAFDVFASQRNARSQQTERQQSHKLPIHDPYSQYEKRELWAFPGPVTKPVQRNPRPMTPHAVDAFDYGVKLNAIHPS